MPIIDIDANTWTLLTDSDVSAARIQNNEGQGVWLQATNGTSAPTDFEEAMMIQPRYTIPADVTLAMLWPGVVSANRVWAYSIVDAKLHVSHA